MVASVKELSNERKAAITAGTSIIIMELAAFFSYGFVHESLDKGRCQHHISCHQIAFLKPKFWGEPSS
ncbi:hypothetical protein AYJ08_07125 [Brevibacillus sp. SKDU10]|uniref:hypothetical protein n=1 Tax=Brevibacillus sp. SKDU10 TaxID=1247872 RepID=UPI0007C88DCD|nr:hypothetical protein AYJ08_07125 [Brevibacillus sp. SKDU10]